MSTLAPRLRPTTEDDITAEVLRRLEGTPDPRLKRVLTAAVRHLHAFVKEVELTVYPEAQHDSWTATYNNPKLYEWFLAHERK